MGPETSRNTPSNQGLVINIISGMSSYERHPLVSVVMCCYNSEKYIAETINSVLNQTYNNFEFIIWNDGSIDDSEIIIKSFHDNRIRYYYHDNTGLGIALGLACKEASGKYIARIDADDICMPDRFEKEVSFLESHEDYVLVGSSVVYIDKDGKTLGRSFPWTWASCQSMRQSVAHPSSMYRREAYMKTCGYLNVRSCEDVVLWSKMVKLGKFYNIQRPLIKYRLLDGSLSHCLDEKSVYFVLLETIRKKMRDDDIVLEDDIRLHNYIFTYVKKHNSSQGKIGYKISLEEKIFNILRLFLGNKISAQLVFIMKNLYIYIHERLQ